VWIIYANTIFLLINQLWKSKNFLLFYISILNFIVLNSDLLYYLLYFFIYNRKIQRETLNSLKLLKFWLFIEGFILCFTRRIIILVRDTFYFLHASILRYNEENNLCWVEKVQATRTDLMRIKNWELRRYL